MLTIACIPTCINVEKPIDTAPAYLLSYKVFEILGPSIRVRKLRLRVSVKSKDIAEGMEAHKTSGNEESP